MLAGGGIAVCVVVVVWVAGALVKDDHRLRTHGPYAVTRHPIYTGLLGDCEKAVRGRMLLLAATSA